MSETLTHSRLSCFRACPRRHWIRYELGIQQEQTEFALRVGSAFHAALEAIDKDQDPAEVLEAGLSDPFDLALVAAMVNGHAIRYADAALEVVATEQEFDLPLVNPSTSRPSPYWRLAGKMDRIVRLPDGRRALMEYKTTSRDFSPGADYWLALHMDQQLSIYVNAARALGYNIETVIYDVTRRPMFRPLKATPESERQYTQKESKLKDGTVRPAGSLYANQRDRDETPEEFAERVAADIAERPDHYFARIEIARLDQDLEDCRAEVWQQAAAVREARSMGRWYRNPGACTGPFPCSYLSICLNRDLETTTPMGFVRSLDIHPELSGIATEQG